MKSTPASVRTLKNPLQGQRRHSIPRSSSSVLNEIKAEPTFPRNYPRLVGAEQFLELLRCLNGKQRDIYFFFLCGILLQHPCWNTYLQSKGNSFSGCLGALSTLQSENAGEVRAERVDTLLSCYTTIVY